MIWNSYTYFINDEVRIPDQYRGKYLEPVSRSLKHSFDPVLFIKQALSSLLAKQANRLQY